MEKENAELKEASARREEERKREREEERGQMSERLAAYANEKISLENTHKAQVQR